MRMAMQRIALVLSIFFWADLGRRVQAAEQVQNLPREEDAGSRSLKSLAKLLVEANPSDAFQAMTGPNGIQGSSTGRIGANIRRANVRASEEVEAKTEEAIKTEKKIGLEDIPDDLESCDIDNLAGCSQQELEIQYVDALWSFYETGKPLLSDEEYNALVNELNWKGSGFPSLRRSEIQFVEAALAFAKGEPIVSDEKWAEMKNEVKQTTGKRREVTEFLLYTRSLRDTSETRDKLFRELSESGIGVTVSPSGISCTLSDVPNTLTANVKDVFEMYLALSAIPTGICVLLWAFVALLLGGPEELLDTASFSLPLAGVAAYVLTASIIKYVELAQPELLEGQCPCCEEKIAYMSTSYTDKQPKLTCQSCKTDLELDVNKREIGKAFGLNVIGTEVTEETGGKWIDSILTKNMLNAISDNVLGLPNEKTKLGAPEKGKKEVVPEGATALSYALDHLGDGLFAWLIYIGYFIFGENFVQRVRGKGISLHSQAINSFCARYHIPKKLNQIYIQTAKRNGEDLGFLVPGAKLFGDGLFGKPALAWWKAQGF